MATITVSFTLDTERDRKMFKWLESLPQGGRSKAIRDVLRASLGHTPVTLGDVYQAVKELERTLQGGAFVTGTVQEGDAPDVPPDVIANLGKLGL